MTDMSSIWASGKSGSFTRIHDCHRVAMDFTNWMPDAHQYPVVLRDTDVAYRPDPVTEVHGYHPISLCDG